MLSIIIPTCKRTELLQIGLSQLRQQHIKEPYEILVLNDGIEDETEYICKQYDAKYIFTGLRNKDKFIWRCPGFAINIGVKQSLGEIICLTVPEIYHSSKNLIQQYFNIVTQDPKAIATTVGYDDTLGYFLRYVQSGGEWNTFNRKDLLRDLCTDYPFCLMMYKQEFVGIRGYDEDFIGFAWDDTDLMRRLIWNGCHYVKLNQPIIHLYHDRASREGLYNKEKQFEYNKNLYNTRDKIIIRNIGKDWGVLQ